VHNLYFTDKCLLWGLPSFHIDKNSSLKLKMKKKGSCTSVFSVGWFLL